MAVAVIRIVLIDDHDLVRRGLRTLLESEDGLEVVGEAADGNSALALVEEHLPDVALVDVIMPGKDGIEATRDIKAAFPAVKVIVLSGHDEKQFIFDALKAGASGYVLKTTALEKLVETVRAAAENQPIMEPAFASRVLTEFDGYRKTDLAQVFQPLTPREREILQKMSDGLPNKTIASRLSISERTVTTHIANIYTKLHVNNRVSAIQEGMKRRLLDFNPQ